MVAEIDLGIDELSDFQVIGRGGFSTIYSAQDSGFNRRVAVKLLHSLDDSGRRRFDRERGIMGQLSSHPNVIMPFRAGYTSTGAPYLVMELVTGGSLQDLIDTRGGLPWREAVELVVPVTAALGHAHEQGILHRDVKPANIVLAGRIPKLTDFGIAAIRESTTTQVAYTLAHCPPEAFATGADTRDDRSDLYSMASTLYNLITGRPPYYIDGTDSPQAYMFRIMGHAIPPLPPEVVPPALWAFLERAMAKDPGDRPQSAQAFEDELRDVLAAAGGPAVTAPPPAVAPTAWPAPTPPSPPTTPPAHVSGPPAAGISAPAAHVSTDETVMAPWADRSRDSGEGFGLPPAGDPTVISGPGPLAPAPSPTPFVHSAPAPAPFTDSGPEGGVVGFHPSPGAAPKAKAPGRGPKLVALVAAVALVAVAAGGGWLWWSSRQSGPQVAWTFETESSLASQPAVADGVLVIGAHVTNTVYGIDVESGEQKWAYVTQGSIDSSPVIADGVAYVGSQDGSVYALDLATGEPRWQQPLGAKVTSGTAVVGGLVIVGTERGTVWALDPADGSTVWSARAGSQVINSTPVSVTRDGRELVVVGSTDGGLYFLDSGTGREVTKVVLDGGIWFSRPLVLDQLDADGNPRPGHQELWVGSSGQNRGFLNRVDADTSEVDTFANKAGVGTAPAVTADGLIIAGNDAGEMFAVDRRSLGEAWRAGYADATQIKGSPVVHGDQVIFGTHDKELVAVTAADGDVLWRFKGEQIFGLSAPVVVGDQLYVGNDSGTIYRFDL